MISLLKVVAYVYSISFNIEMAYNIFFSYFANRALFDFNVLRNYKFKIVKLK